MVGITRSKVIVVLIPSNPFFWDTHQTSRKHHGGGRFLSVFGASATGFNVLPESSWDFCDSLAGKMWDCLYGNM